MNLLESMF